jgi:hypothetical protein
MVSPQSVQGIGSAYHHRYSGMLTNLIMPPMFPLPFIRRTDQPDPKIKLRAGTAFRLPLPSHSFSLVYLLLVVIGCLDNV